ncbi:MAG TPA: DUF554 domain-containing protein [Bacteroidetes bacterium]|nr:DUF554 domain-containing protein [Bacteroidota bacterium]
MPIGTLVNMSTVIVGSLTGFFLKKRYPEKIKIIVFQAIGIVTVIIGMKMAFEVKNLLTFIFSLLLGGITGELVKLDSGIDRLIAKVQSKFKAESSKHFSEGIITAFLIFCMGSMTIVGALNEGLKNDHTLLLTKSILDGFTSIALASTYGIGVLFSIIPLFLYQGGITILAVIAKDFFSQLMISQLTAIGGAIIIGLGINLLDLKNIKVLNLLPSLVYIVVFTLIFH